MKVGIFYFSTNAGIDRAAIRANGHFGAIGYVRAEVVEAESEEDAMERHVQPMPDESLMNTHAITRPRRD